MTAKTADPDRKRAVNTDAVSAEFGREDAFKMLSNERRRYVAHYLLTHEGQSELRDLAREIAAWENDKRPEAVTSEERRRVYNALQQVHLPKLDDVGVVEFDADRSTVSASENLTDLEVYLEIVPGREIPWSQYYLLLGLFCASVALAAWTGLYPFGRVSGALLLGGAALLLTCSGLAHVYYSRKIRIGGASARRASEPVASEPDALVETVYARSPRTFRRARRGSRRPWCTPRCGSPAC